MPLGNYYLDILNKVKKNLLDISEEISVARTRVNRYREEIIEMKKQLRDKRAIKGTAFAAATAEIAAKSKEILWNNILIAAEKNQEYNHENFLSGLKRAVEDDRTIVIKFDEKNFNITSIDIDLNLTAGTLEEWANAVKEARDTLREYRGGRYIKDADVASRIWKEKIYGVDREGKSVSRRKKNKKTGKEVTIDVTEKFEGKYWFTMGLRFINMKSPAPWWELLDKGNISLGSDWGGQPYPQSESTNFVLASIGGIKYIFNNTFEERKWEIEYSLKSSISIYEKWLEEAEEFLEELEKLNMQSELEEFVANYIQGIAAKPPEQITRKFTVALDKVARRLNKLEKIQVVNISRLTTLVDQLSKGVLGSGRFRLGHDVRVRVIQIHKQMEDEIRRLRIE